jgi:transglutaminase-like putative cysteine protease
MQFKVTHITKYNYSEASPVCHNEVRLTPRSEGRQCLLEHQLHIRPEFMELGRRVDYFGNHLRLFSIQEPHTGMTLTATSTVQVSPPPELNLDDSPPWETVRDGLSGDKSPQGRANSQFLYPSPRIGPSQEFSRELADYTGRSFSPGRPLLQAASDLTARIHQEFKYDPKATTVDTPIEEAFAHRRGVCQDFAHLQIACLRSIGLAARYVSGYLRTLPPPGKPRLVGADATHAWPSVYAGLLGWVDFDPTNNVIAGTDHITLTWGRDYSDVTPVCGVFTGGGSHTLCVSVDVAPLDA